MATARKDINDFHSNAVLALTCVLTRYYMHKLLRSELPELWNTIALPIFL